MTKKAPKKSQWFATPRDMRKRKPLAITLSDEAHLRLRGIAAAKHGGNLSAAIEFLIMASIAVAVAACGGAPVDAPEPASRPAHETTTEPYRLEAPAPRTHGVLVTEPEDDGQDPPTAVNCKHEAPGPHAAGCLEGVAP